ncbi:hypothetical protein GBA52_007883 [Prunus armeniaca]|nr:hypothetical protein GBA52_007883 [Prunus armeniaca]
MAQHGRRLDGAIDNSEIHWGGVMTNLRIHGRHAPTQMGGRQFPHEDFGKARYIRSLQYADVTGSFKDPERQTLRPFAIKSLCYGVSIPHKDSEYESHMHFGGPGHSKDCPT